MEKKLFPYRKCLERYKKGSIANNQKCLNGLPAGHVWTAHLRVYSRFPFDI